MKIKNLLIALTGLFSLAMVTLAVAENASPVSSFKAQYEIFSKMLSIGIGKQGLPIGEATLTLAYDGKGHYRMSSDVHPSGLASLLVSEQIKEQVSGEVRDGAIFPTHYEQQRAGRKARIVKLNFDWREGVVRARKNDEKATLPLTPRVVDPLSLHLQVMTDLQNGKQINQYTLVSETELKTYQIRRDGTEILETPLGSLKTLRISKQKPGSDRVTMFWFAPALDYLPVQITQEKKGSEDLRMVIKEVDGIALK